MPKNKIMKKFFTLFILIEFGIFASEFLIEQKSKNIKIDWSLLKIIASSEEPIYPVVFDEKDPEFGNNESSLSITESRSKSQKKLKEKLLSELSHSVENLKFDSESSISEKIRSTEKFREKFNKIFQSEIGEYKVAVKGNKVVSEIAIPFYGRYGLLNFLEIDFQSEEFPEFPKIQNPVEYTGLVVDARHLSGEASLLPRISTENGLEIYSPELVSKNYAIDQGYVLFQSDPVVAMKHKRAGTNPYFVYALTARGHYKTDFSIPSSDAVKILGNKKTVEHLKKCKVIIVKNFEKLNQKKP